MRIFCPHCKQKAIITSHSSLTDTVQDLYVQCMNTSDCGKKMVWRLSFNHDLDPLNEIELIKILSARLNKDQRAKITRDLFNPSLTN